MTQALARVRGDVLSRKIKLTRKGNTLLRSLATRIAGISPRACIAVALCMIIAGIAMNALLMQRGRHPAPLFGSTKPLAIAVPIAAPREPSRGAVGVAPPPVAAPLAPAAQLRTVPPNDTTMTSKAVRHPEDAIGQLLHQEKTQETDRLLQSARLALGKLGFPLKLDSDDATVREAIVKFERSHGWTVSHEITPHTVRRLAEAARDMQR